MPKLGPSPWDDQGYLLGNLEPRLPGSSLGTPGHSFRGMQLESAGEVTVNQGNSVVVNDTNITDNSIVLFGLKTVGGTPAAAPYVFAKTAGTSFTVRAGTGDTSVYNYFIINLDT